MEDTFIVDGVDTVPSLKEYIFKGPPGHRLRALKLLCDMDRFVPDAEIPLETARGQIYVEASRHGGRINPFIPIDGHRIGKEGLDAISSAAQQTENKLIQFYARYFTGEIKRELQKLPLEEQIRLWRDAVVKTRIVIREGAFPESSSTFRTIEEIWMERMPEPIPRLTELLEQDKNPYVREELVHVFGHADECSVRLRNLDSGRLAIDAVRRALEHGSFEFGLKQEQQRKDELKIQLGHFMKDEVEIAPVSRWALYGQALESFYDDKLIVKYDPKWRRPASPEIRRFVTYLTDKDPNFLRWEYTYCKGNVGDEVIHPRFRARMERLHSEWQQFSAQQQVR